MILGGVGFMVFLLFMRYTFIWWPLHPVGYIMHLSWATKCLWASFFIGWLLKFFILRMFHGRHYSWYCRAAQL